MRSTDQEVGKEKTLSLIPGRLPFFATPLALYKAQEVACFLASQPQASFLALLPFILYGKTEYLPVSQNGLTQGQGLIDLGLYRSRGQRPTW